MNNNKSKHTIKIIRHTSKERNVAERIKQISAEALKKNFNLYKVLENK